MAVVITGNNTPTAGGITYGDGTTYAVTAAGTSGRPIVSGGSGAPTFRPYTLPASDGSANQVLQTNGSGALSFATPSAGALTFISSVTASSSATVSFTSIGATYDTYMITFTRVIPATDNVRMRLRTSTDNGATYYSTAGDYKYASMSLGSNGTTYDAPAGDGEYIEMQGTSLDNDANSGGLNGVFYLYKPASANTILTTWNTAHVQNTGTVVVITNGAGGSIPYADVDAIQFYMGSGNIASGTFRLYGIANS
jgi:hypothetical protein